MKRIFLSILFAVPLLLSAQTFRDSGYEATNFRVLDALHFKMQYFPDDIMMNGQFGGFKFQAPAIWGETYRSFTFPQNTENKNINYVFPRVDHTHLEFGSYDMKMVTSVAGVEPDEYGNVPLSSGAQDLQSVTAQGNITHTPIQAQYFKFEDNALGGYAGQIALDNGYWLFNQNAANYTSAFVKFPEYLSGTPYIYNFPATSGTVVLKDSMRGVVFNKTSFANASDFTSTGVTTSIVSGAIRMAAGTGDFARYMVLNNSTNTDENIEVEVKFIIRTAIGAAAYGFGIGKRSINTNYPNTVIGQFSMVTGGNAGLYLNQGNFTNVKSAVDATMATFSVGDACKMVWRQNGNVITLYCENTTTGYARTIMYKDDLKDVTAATSYLPTTGQIAIYQVGNQIIDITAFKVTSFSKLNQRFALVGDSKFVGFGSADIYKRIGAFIPNSITYAGGGDKTAELAASVPYLITLKPQTVLLNIGRNDLGFGIASGIWQANYASIVSQLTTAGIKVIHVLPMPESVDQTALYNYITTTYGKKNCIDPVGAGYIGGLNSADGVHPSPAGMVWIADLINSSQLIN